MADDVSNRIEVDPDARELGPILVDAGRTLVELGLTPSTRVETVPNPTAFSVNFWPSSVRRIAVSPACWRARTHHGRRSQTEVHGSCGTGFTASMRTAGQASAQAAEKERF